MNKCPYSKTEHKQIQSQESRSDRQPVGHRTIKLQWCDHSHSPVTKDHMNFIGGSRQLLCEGNLDKCFLSREEFADIIN